MRSHGSASQVVPPPICAMPVVFQRSQPPLGATDARPLRSQPSRIPIDTWCASGLAILAKTA